MDYVISGKVIKGDGYGRKIGFPTMNLEANTKELPKAGVYAGIGNLDGIDYRTGIVVGPEDKLEAHLIGYNGDAYGKQVTLKIEKFIREYKKFNTEEELIIQIKKDLKLC
ncbi:riboflavin kinase [Candidatus Nomurabacteria bacterium]|nr:riboflavin kinase [Candidatus Nomurabacteria bacterium]